MKRILLAAALAATTAIAVPIIARSAEDAELQQAQVAQADEQQGEEHGGGPGRWMRGEGGPGVCVRLFRFSKRGRQGGDRDRTQTSRQK